MKKTLVECVLSAGQILSQHFGKDSRPYKKGNLSDVVCAADIASEKFIIRKIRSDFPKHNIISEELGWTKGSSDLTWVVDPLDGTSNFVAGIPWFGVQIAILKGITPVISAMFLPCDKTLYLSEIGTGTYRDGRRVRVTLEKNPQNILLAFGMDASANRLASRHGGEIYVRAANGVRNIRTTNSLLDNCYVIDGRLGGCINLNPKIWDIAPASLMFTEAGGKLTDLHGNPISFKIDETSLNKDYPILGASNLLHSKLLTLIAAEKAAPRKG